MNQIPASGIEVPLSQGKTAIVDPDDYPTASLYRWRWTQAGAATNIGGRTTLLHRYLTDAPEGTDVIFLNSNKADCRRSNMQLVDRGYAQWIDRDVYGIRSLLPLLERIESTNVDVGRRPQTVEEAHELRVQVGAEIDLIQRIWLDSRLTETLSTAEKDRWFRDLKAVRRSKETIIRQINKTIRDMNMAKRDMSMRLADEKTELLKQQKAGMTPRPSIDLAEKMRKQAERKAKWIAHQERIATMLGKETGEGLLIRMIVMLTNIRDEGRVVYTDDERAVLDAAIEYIRCRDVAADGG